jgi:hypothetical protein
MLSALLQSVRSLDKARVAKSGGVSAIITVGLTMATVAGAPIPGWAPFVGSLVGIAVYKMLPKKEEQEVDDIVDKAIDIATTIPQTYADYSGTGNDTLPPVTTNLTTKDGTKVGV